MIEGYEMNSNSDSKKNIKKDAFLTIYTSLKKESIQRAGTQSTVIGLLIGLTGAFVGLLIVIAPPGEKIPILLTIFNNP